MSDDSKTRAIRSHSKRMLFILGLAVGGVLVGATASGQVAPPPGGEGGSTDPVVRIEEDWQLVLNEPDSMMEAPQFQTVMSPFGTLFSYYALVIWNYRETPNFAPGGLQLQSWDGDVRICRRGVGDTLLSTTAETITWTQALETNGSLLTFQILNGQSVTWGEFGKDMLITQTATVPNLSSYRTAISVDNSWITYGSNRVDRMVITQVRRYTASGQVTVDSTPKVVFERTDTGNPDPEPLPQD
jgi:hypothetical protein